MLGFTLSFCILMRPVISGPLEVRMLDTTMVSASLVKLYFDKTCNNLPWMFYMDFKIFVLMRAAFAELLDNSLDEVPTFPSHCFSHKNHIH